jgi:hypothetical protein
MRRLFVFAALVLISVTLSAQSRGQRERDEWQKYEEQATNVCFGPGRSLVLGYTPLDRRQFYPVVFSPDLQPDLLKRITAVFHLKDDDAQNLLAADVNSALNQHIDELRNGTYNKIEIVLGRANALTVTPAESGGTDILIWIPEGAGWRTIDVLGGSKPRDTVYLLTGDGKFDFVKTRGGPSWLKSHDLFTQTGGKFVYDRRRAKKLVDCK